MNEEPTANEEPIDLIQVPSPHGYFNAGVAQDSRIACFYLAPLEPDADFDIRVCWVRNLLEAPSEPETVPEGQGLGTRMPRPYCRHPDGAPGLRPEDLEILWLPAGDGAALREKGELLAFFPPWNGRDGISGHARDCIGETPLASGLDLAGEELSCRLAEAERYWRSWSGDDTPWPAYSSGAMNKLKEALGEHSRYYAIDGGEWPPKALLEFRRPEAILLVTVGVALRPQPRVELHYEDAAPHRRFELALALPTDTSGEVLERCANYMSSLAILPWRRLTFLAHRHTVACDCLPAGEAGEPFTAVLLAKDPPGGPQLVVPSVDGDPVNLLRMVPITDAERGSAHLAETHFRGAWFFERR